MYRSIVVVLIIVVVLFLTTSGLWFKSYFDSIPGNAIAPAPMQSEDVLTETANKTPLKVEVREQPANIVTPSSEPIPEVSDESSSTASSTDDSRITEMISPEQATAVDDPELVPDLSVN